MKVQPFNFLPDSSFADCLVIDNPTRILLKFAIILFWLELLECHNFPADSYELLVRYGIWR